MDQHVPGRKEKETSAFENSASFNEFLQEKKTHRGLLQEHARTIIKRKECVLRNAKEHAFECQPIVFGSDSFLMKGLRLTRENSQGATGYASHCPMGRTSGIGINNRATAHAEH